MDTRNLGEGHCVQLKKMLIALTKFQRICYFEGNCHTAYRKKSDCFDKYHPQIVCKALIPSIYDCPAHFLVSLHKCYSKFIIKK